VIREIEIYRWKGSDVTDIGFRVTMEFVLLHDIIGPLQKRGSIFYKTTQILAYADDIVIISRTLADLKDTVLKIDNKSRETGLLINEVKTKYMKMSRLVPRRKPVDLRVGAYCFEGVSIFT
jgi:sorting nexin-29